MPVATAAPAPRTSPLLRRAQQPRALSACAATGALAPRDAAAAAAADRSGALARTLARAVRARGGASHGDGPGRPAGPVLARWTDLTTLRRDALVADGDARRRELELFIRVQRCLRNTRTVKDRLRQLIRQALEEETTATQLIADREREVGLTDAGAILFENVPTAMFQQIVAAREIFVDVGASPQHGALSHRAQWYVVSFELSDAELKTAYRASVDDYWLRTVDGTLRFPWDEIVDVPIAERADAAYMSPENVRDLLSSLELPEQESFDTSLSREVRDSVPGDAALPAALRGAGQAFKAWTKPSDVTDPVILGELFMKEKGLVDVPVRSGRFMYTGWRMFNGQLIATVAYVLDAGEDDVVMEREPRPARTRAGEKTKCCIVM